MMPRTPLRSLSHSWGSNNGRQHHKYSGHHASAAAASAVAAVTARNGKHAGGYQKRSSSLRDGGSDAADTSTAAQAVARYRARQFNQSWDRSTPEHIGGVDCGTPYLHQTPAGKPRIDWTPSPTTAADDSGMPTPVLCPEQTPCRSDISMDDSIDSVRGVGNGGILIGKIRELQRQLDVVKKEKNDMESQIEALKAGNQLLLGGGDHSNRGGSDGQDDDQDIEYDSTEEDRHGEHVPQEENLESSRRSLDFRNDNDDGSKDNDGEALAATSGSTNSMNSVMSDDQMIQAMSKITHGVHQLEGALRKHLSSSTRSSVSTSSRRSSAEEGGEFVLTERLHPAERLNLGRGDTAGSAIDVMAGSRSSSTMGGSGMILGDVVCGHGTPSWWARLQCGDMVDGRDKDRRWYAACVERIEGKRKLGGGDNNDRDSKCSSPRGDGRLEFRVKISFEGWSSDWDIWLHSQKDIAELAPRGTHVKMSLMPPPVTHENFQLSSRGNSTHATPRTSAAVESPPSSSDASDDVDVSTDLSSAAGSEGTPRCDSGVKESWDLNSSLSPVEFAISGRDQLAPPTFTSGGSVLMRARVRAWKVADVAAWVASTLELPQYQKHFKKASVDGLMLLRVGREDLDAIGVGDKLHALKILSHLDDMRA